MMERRGARGSAAKVHWPAERLADEDRAVQGHIVATSAMAQHRSHAVGEVDRRVDRRRST